MRLNQTIAVSLAVLALACVAVLTALKERTSRSPAALLEKNGKLEMLYPYGYGSGYGYPYGGYSYDPYGYGYGYGYDGYGYGDYYDGYSQYAAAAQQQQYSDYLQQRQYADWAQQQSYYNWAVANSAYKSIPEGDKILRVADGSKNQKLVYMGDFEFNGYKKEITGGNDGGFNAPFDINGDGQEIDNWAKVTTQWKHRKGQAQLAQRNMRNAASMQQLAGEPSAWDTGYEWYHGNTKPWSWYKNPPGLPAKGQTLPGGRVVS